MVLSQGFNSIWGCLCLVSKRKPKETPKPILEKYSSVSLSEWVEHRLPGPCGHPRKEWVSL